MALRESPSSTFFTTWALQVKTGLSEGVAGLSIRQAEISLPFGGLGVIKSQPHGTTYRGSRIFTSSLLTKQRHRVYETLMVV